MNVLVTGGAGFIGTNLIKELLKRGHTVTSVDDYSTKLKSNQQDGADYFNGDITKIRNYPCAPDVVYHLAAVARIQPSFDQPERYFDVNAKATIKVAQFCCRYNIPLVYAGSSSHHSGKFKNPYTFSKDVGEEVLKLFEMHYGLKATIARFYNVYGPHHLKEGGYCTLIGAWEKQIENNKPLTIYGDGTKRRDFTHVQDIVDALILISQKNAWGHIFELGRGKNYSVKEIADMFGKEVQYKEDKKGEAMVTLCTDTAAKDILGWEPKHNIQDYINDYLNGKDNIRTTE